MATSSLDYAGALGERVLRVRPLFALAVVWITTAGHTMNFREMDAARGWVPAQGYGLHSALLFAIAVGFLLARMLPSVCSALQGTRLALLGLTVGSLVNGICLLAPYEVLLASRVGAGLCAGAILRLAPGLLPPSYQGVSVFLGILLPAMAPGLVGGATFLYGWSNWEGGFLFEGGLALLALALFLPSLGEEAIPHRGEFSLRKFVALIFFSLVLGCFWYIGHRGQLDGWLESQAIFLSSTLAAFGLLTAMVLSGSGVLTQIGANLFPRLVLIFFAGVVQFFNVSDMGVYGGLILNFSTWERAWLVGSLSFGAAAALISAPYLRRFGPLHLAGLLTLAFGMYLAHEQTLGWNYWNPLNQIEFNWFPAPQHWQLALARFCMGLGVGWILFSMQQFHAMHPGDEEEAQTQVIACQFLGGACSVGFLVTYLLIGHQAQYSFTSERGFIQIQAVEEYRVILQGELDRRGFISPEAGSHSLMFRAMNYEADNLVFAHFYNMFLWSAMALAVVCALAWIFSWWKTRLTDPGPIP